MLNWKDTRHPLAGGAEFYTKRVLEELVARGHSVTWFTAAVAGEAERENDGGISIVRRGSRLGVYREARRFVREHSCEFDVVIDQVNTIPFLAHRWSEVPVVALYHQLAREVWFSETPFGVSAAGRFVVEPALLWLMRAVPSVTVSESSRASLLEAGIRDVKNLGQGGELGEIAEASRGVRKADVPTFAFCGRLGRSKRPVAALDAFALYSKSHPDAVLHVIGDGPLRATIQEHTSRSRAGRVVVHGRVSFAERCGLIAESWALLVPSVREGWGLVVSEAAAGGTKAIGYDVPGLRDSVPASGGVLCEPRPEAMALVMRESAESMRDEPVSGETGTISWEELATAWEKLLTAHASRH
jgi:glycosyltransferase involved in cell wall biosynthesis